MNVIRIMTQSKLMLPKLFKEYLEIEDGDKVVLIDCEDQNGKFIAIRKHENLDVLFP